MYRVQWAIVLAVSAIGFVGYLVFVGPRAAVSFVVGALLAGTLLSGGIAAVRWADRIIPALSMVIALLTYSMVVVILAAVLAASNPDVVNAPALAVGLVAAAVALVVVQLRDARPGNGS